MENLESALEVSPVTLPFWSELSTEKRGIAWSYATTGYSIARTAEELEIPVPVVQKALQDPAVRSAVAEIQQAQGEIEFLNERWVKEQLLLLYPKFLGEEEIPLVTACGEQIRAKKFHPEALLKVLEYVAPKKTSPAVVVNVANIHRLSDEQLEEIAAKALPRKQITIEMPLEQGE